MSIYGRIIILISAYLIVSITTFWLNKKDKKICKKANEVNPGDFDSLILSFIARYHINIIINTLVSIIILCFCFPSYIFFSIKKIYIMMAWLIVCLAVKAIVHIVLVNKKRVIKSVILCLVMAFVLLLLVSIMGSFNIKNVTNETKTEITPTVNALDLQDQVKDYKPSLGKMIHVDDTTDYYFFYVEELNNTCYVKINEKSITSLEETSGDTKITEIRKEICTTNPELKSTTQGYQTYSTEYSYQILVNPKQIVEVIE